MTCYLKYNKRFRFPAAFFVTKVVFLTIDLSNGRGNKKRKEVIDRSGAQRAVCVRAGDISRYRTIASVCNWQNLAHGSNRNRGRLILALPLSEIKYMLL